MAAAPVSLERPIAEKIAWARKCLEDHGPLLLRDQVVQESLFRLREVSLATRGEMARVGVIEACRVCEEDEGGSCCGTGIENRYESIMLVINGLLGVELPGSRQLPQSCYFLGEKGCVLQARHVLCVNYLCDRVTSKYGPKVLAVLRAKEGEELELILVLYERIRKILATL